MGDQSVDDLYKTYLTKLRSRAAFATKLSSLSAPATFQSVLNAASGTDLNAHLAFMESARKYHGQLKAFYYPFLFNNKPFSHADYDQEPQHTYQSNPDSAAIYSGLLILFISNVLVYAAAFLLQRITTSEIR